MQQQPIPYFKFRPEWFPFTIRMLDTDTETEVWSAIVQQAGPVRIPARRKINGGKPVTIVMEMGDGTTQRFPPEC